MFNIYLEDKLLGSYDDSKEELFYVYCSTHNIPFLKNTQNDYLVFPVLSDSIVAISTLDNTEKTSEKVVKRLSDRFTEQGALVLHTSMQSSYKKLLQVMQVHILLSLNHQKSRDDGGCVNFYYSLQQKEESLKLIASIIKRLATQKSLFRYEIPSVFNYVSNLRYYKFYFSTVPTVVMELNNIDSIQEECLEQAVLEGVVQHYRKIAKVECFELIKGLLEILEEKSLILEMEQVEEQASSNDLENDLVGVEDKITKTGEACYLIDGLDGMMGETNEPEMDKTTKSNVKDDLDEYEEKEILKETVDETIKKDLPFVKIALGMGKESKKKTQNIINTSLVKKKKRKSRVGTSLFPPSDGPVYQFSPPTREESLGESYCLPFEKEGISFRDSCAYGNSFQFQRNNEGLENINALDELRKLADVVRQEGKDIEERSNQ
ncbi:MAG: hypothetical protein PHI90_02615 [Clostridia bacterium]|nr:hypothetical protein [Clostridia bacterium]MDD4047714.1 hypothetical protein [Clostridia bacterium]